MKLKALMIVNGPEEDETLIDFVESTLDVSVSSVEYSHFFERAVLITIEEGIDFEAAEKILKENDDVQESQAKRLEVFDPVLRHDTIVVEDLDEEYLTQGFLKLYFESTFADGYRVVSKCELTPITQQTILTLTDKKVVSNILANQDHVPLPSENYHITVKPFYTNFHTKQENLFEKKSSLEKKSIEEKVCYGKTADAKVDGGCLPSCKDSSTAHNVFVYKKETSSEDDLSSCKDGSAERTFFVYKRETSSEDEDVGKSMCSEKNVNPEQWGTTLKHDVPLKATSSEHLKKNSDRQFNSGGKTSHSDKPFNTYQDKSSTKNSNKNTQSDIVLENERLQMPKSKWSLVKEKIQAMTCHCEYKEKERFLSIQSTDAATHKGDIIELLRGICTSSFDLSIKQIEFLEDEKVKSSIQEFLDLETEASSFEISDNSLAICSYGNSGNILEKVTSKFLETNTIQLPEGISLSKVKECYNFSREYLVKASCDDGLTELTVIGLQEDVNSASASIKELLKKYTYVEKTFELLGHKAIYVNKYAMDRLEDLFGGNIIGKMNCPKSVYFKYKCQQTQLQALEDKLKDFAEDIQISEVDFKDFGREDLVLIKRSLKTNTIEIDRFQSLNQCCVFVEDFESQQFRVHSAKENEEEKKVSQSQSEKGRRMMPSYSRRQRKVSMIGPSCKLQVKPVGNIKRERTDLLVCGIDQSRDLDKTKVSGTFLRMDRNLQTEIANYTFSSNGVCVVEKTFARIKCKAVAFITLEVWQRGVSDQQLKAAVTEVLDKANSLAGVTSVSFPPLGFGRAFKFPPQEVAATIMAAIKSFLDTSSGNHTIKLINCLTPDRVLFNEMNKCVDSVFVRDNSDESDSDSDSDEDEDLGEGGGAKALVSSDEEDDEKPEMRTSSYDDPPCVTIVHSKSKQSNNDAFASKFKNVIKRNWLSVDTFETDKISYFTPQFMTDIFQKANLLGVWVTKMEDSSKKKISFEIKGNHNDILRMIYQIEDNLCKTSYETQNAPSDFHFPPYWKLKGRDFEKDYNGMMYRLVDIDANTSKVIENLCKATWQQQSKDSKNIDITKIRRIENAKLFLKYLYRQKFTYDEIAQSNRTCKNVGDLRGSGGELKTMKYLPDEMKKELVNDVNEVYLFYSSNNDSRKTICDQGMSDLHVSGDKLFGKGIYLHEMAGQAGQEGSTSILNSMVQRLRSKKTMFLTRVIMGDVFLCGKNHESFITGQKLRRAPCVACHKDACACGKVLHHSVMGNKSWQPRDIVVYENYQCYPEYLIEYKLV